MPSLHKSQESGQSRAMQIVLRAIAYPFTLPFFLATHVQSTSSSFSFETSIE